MDNLRAMRVFVEVAECASFASAARRLNLSSSSASRLVGDLEAWLGTTLLRRNTRNVVLSEAGERFLDDCRAIVRASDDLLRDARALAEVPRGALNVSVSRFMARARIAPLMPAFHAAYPDITVDLHVDDRLSDLIADRIDVAVRVSRLADSDMIARKCSDMRMMLTASPGFLKKYGMPENIDALGSFPCLVDKTAPHKGRWPLGKRSVVSGPVTANDGEVVRQMTVDGLGISFLPDFFVEDDVKAGRLVNLFPEAVTTEAGIYALFPSRRQITPASRAFVDFLVASLKPG